MHEQISIENRLRELMPSPLSASTTRAIEDAIDELNGGFQGIAPTPPDLRSRRRLVTVGIAAAVAFVIGTGAWRNAANGLEGLRRAGVWIDSAAQTEGGRVLAGTTVVLSESDRVESISDEGLWADGDGSAHHEMRVILLSENSMRDEETGIVFEISEPREEIFLMPVSTF